MAFQPGIPLQKKAMNKSSLGQASLQAFAARLSAEEQPLQVSGLHSSACRAGIVVVDGNIRTRGFGVGFRGSAWAAAVRQEPGLGSFRHALLLLRSGLRVHRPD